MKFNKQKIDEIKNKITNVRKKIACDKKEKVPKKYYALLILMLLLGVVTLSNNIKQYKISKQEDFREYELEQKTVDSDFIEVSDYITAESSISTSIANIEQEVIETIAVNNKSYYIMPVVGEVIKEFAQEKLVYSETLGMWKTHPGIDIKAELNTDVKSASDGEVIVIQKDTFYGNTVKIKDNQGYIFIYSNLDNNIALKEGNKIKKGDKIGEVGVSAAGELLDKTHLHFEVIKNGTQVDPQDLINK